MIILNFGKHLLRLIQLIIDKSFLQKKIFYIQE